MKPQIRKDPSEGGWLLTTPGAPHVPIVTVVCRRFPTWPEAMRACDQWHFERDMFEAVAATRAEETCPS